jgi:hypothetical protein
LLIAVGFESMMFKRDVTCFVLLIASLFFSYSYGLSAMGLAFLLNGLVEGLITLWMLRSAVQLSIPSLFVALIKPALVAAVCLAGAVGLDLLYPFAYGQPILILLMLAVTMPLLWLLTTKLLKLQIYFEVSNLIKAGVGRFSR